MTKSGPGALVLHYANERSLRQVAGGYERARLRRVRAAKVRGARISGYYGGRGTNAFAVWWQDGEMNALAAGRIIKLHPADPALRERLRWQPLGRRHAELVVQYGADTVLRFRYARPLKDLVLET